MRALPRLALLIIIQEMKAKPLSAVILESSVNGRQSWETNGIYTYVWEAALKAREIPWDTRLRYVNCTPENLVDDTVVQEALKDMGIINSLLQEYFNPAKP